LKDAAKLGLKTKFMINVWGFDENLPKLVGPAAEGRAFGMLPVAPFGVDVPGMTEPLKMAGDKKYTLHYIKSWVSVAVMFEGMKRAKKAGKLNGPGLKAALETIKDFETGGLASPITFTPKDHRPTTKAAIAAASRTARFI
jgi:branched-chain amino acid transport system substrate-binding protein